MNTVGFERREHSQAESFLCAACIGHDQVSGQGAKMPSSALGRGIIGLEINRKVWAQYGQSFGGEQHNDLVDFD